MRTGFHFHLLFSKFSSPSLLETNMNLILSHPHRHTRPRRSSRSAQGGRLGPPQWGLRLLKAQEEGSTTAEHERGEFYDNKCQQRLLQVRQGDQGDRRQVYQGNLCTLDSIAEK